MGKLKLDERPTLRGVLVAAYSIGDLLAALKKVAKPSDELKGIVERVDKLVVKYEEGEGTYGRILDVATLTRIRKELAGVPEKDEASVKRALKILGVLLGEEEVVVPGEPKGKGTRLEGYGTAEIVASAPGRPGWYRLRLVKAGPSLNGLTWKPEVLQAAVEAGLFENVPLSVFTWSDNYGTREDHLEKGSPFRGYAVGNQIGFVRNATWDPSEMAVYGEGFVADTTRRVLIDEVLRSGGTAGLGLSIVADGDTTPSDEVERLYGVKGFDMVTYPAAEGQFVGTLVMASVSRWGKESRKMEVRAAEEAPPKGGEAEGAAEGLPTPAAEGVDQGAAVQAVIEQVQRLEQEFGQAESARDSAKMEELARQGMEVIRNLPDLGFECWRAGANVPGTVLDLVNRAWEAKAQGATVAGKEEIEKANTTVEGGRNVDEVKLGDALSGIQRQQAAMGQMLKELQASVAAVQRRDALSDVESLVERTMTEAGITAPELRRTVRELTAGKVLDQETVKGLVKFARDVHAQAGRKEDERATSVTELRGGVDQAGRSKLRGSLVKLLGLDPSLAGGETK